MVWLRALIYSSNNMAYHFDLSAANLLYEYLKDVRTYFLLCLGIELYRFVLRRWQGEAAVLGHDDSTTEHAANNNQSLDYLERILVKKLDREFLLNTHKIEWITSDGNYQMLHVKGHDYPLRSTQHQLLQSLDPSLFIKAGRGLILNTKFIKAVRHLKAGELNVTLDCGQEFLVSRTYRDNIPTHIKTTLVE